MKPFKFWQKGFRIIPVVVLLIGLAFPAIAFSAQPASSLGAPAVEWLTFQVPVDQQARFIEQDVAIWTPVLSSYPGFQSKEIWTNPTRPDELVIVTHWASREQWKAIPKDVLDRTTQRFNQAVGATYEPVLTEFHPLWRSTP
jgi:uncharacterized protein (TIGR03792 family)